MAVMIYHLKAEMEDGKTFEVTADQRDLAAYEAYAEGRDYEWGKTRYACWNALVRKKKTTMSWEKFNADCVEVLQVKEPSKS